MKEKNGILLVLFGPPGSGKGTQAEMLASRLGFIHYSTGEVFRQEMRKRTPLGIKVESFIVSGRLVPDALVLEVVDTFVKENSHHSIVFDGFPRTIPQAQGLDELLSRRSNRPFVGANHSRFSGKPRLGGLKLTLAVLIDLSDDEVVRRLSSRRQCRVCSNIYNLSFSPPKQPDCCDECGGELYQRKDDQEEIIRERLRVYKKETAPLIEYYERDKRLKRIDGGLGRDQVWELLSQLINTLQPE